MNLADQEPDAFNEAAKKVFNAATGLWYAADVEHHAEGHPGLIGPSSTDTSWDETRAYIDSAIDTLKLIQKRRLLKALDSL